jgi:predicted site-specific integrase-resolvase
MAKTVLLQAADAATAAGVTPAAIGRAAREGRLRVASVTPRGTRLFTRAAVEEYMRRRRDRAAARHTNEAA